MHEEAAIETVHVLLIESEGAGASRVAGLLGHGRGKSWARRRRFEVTRVPSAAAACELLRGRCAPNVVLFDFGVAEPDGPAALVRLQAAAGDAPVIVLADDEGESEALVAIRQGAQDWIPKGELSGPLLARAIRHAIARKDIDVEQRRQLDRLQKARSRTQRQAVELRARARALDATNRELDDFVYVVSHDLKEPLRGIRAYCEMLVEDYEGCLDRAGVGRLDAIRRMCGRLEMQISDLLTYYRVGRMQPSVTRVGLAEVVEGQLAALRTMLEQRNGVVRVKGPLPAVDGHPVLLGMVFGNLISNGLKYNRSKRPAVEIGVVAGEPCTIWVRDNGIGIAREHHEAIFALFRRLHGRKEYEGSGAGLTIVRKIVGGYGGRIWVESELGRGSTFFFSLPLGAAEPTRPPHWGLSRRSAADRATRDPTARKTGLPP